MIDGSDTLNHLRLNLPVILLAGGIILFMMGCSENPTGSEDEELTEEFLAGESAEMGDGTSNVWARMFTGRDSLFFSIGLNVPMNVIENAETGQPDTLILSFPGEVRENTAVQFVGAVWPVVVPGSEPMIVARFYLVSQFEAAAIPVSVPSMVRDTIRAGVHQGELVYYELMIRQSTLMQEQDTPLHIPQPEEAEVPAVIPRVFVADYQEENDRYALTWEGLETPE